MRKPRVIIFDDDVIMLKMLKEFFFYRNYEVLAFKEPTVCPLFETKADRCDKENPCTDILITDFEMPRINGLELLQRQAQLGAVSTSGIKLSSQAQLIWIRETKK